MTNPQPYRHVNETSTGGYMPRERIPGDSYRNDSYDESADQAGPDVTMEQIQQAVNAVLEQFEIEPIAAGELIGAVIEAQDTSNGQLVDVVRQAAAENGYPNLDVAAFCQVVGNTLGGQR